jgi:hypothetical protein
MAVFIGDFGTRIKIVGQDEMDLSGAVSSQIKFVKPSGASGAWPGTIVNNAVTYFTNNDDLDEAGTWQIQAFVDLGSWSGHSTVQTMKVKEPIS